jgi:transposase-like protein
VAGADSMTIEEVVKHELLDEHADVIREAAKAVAAELMQLEVSELIGAERGERRPEDREGARMRLAALHRALLAQLLWARPQKTNTACSAR